MREGGCQKLSYKDHIPNEEVRREIQAAIWEYDELPMFSHVSSSSCIPKTILQGTLNGKKKKRQAKEKVGR